MTKAHKLAAKEQLSEIGKLQKTIREKTDDFSTMITSVIDLACLFTCIYSMDLEEEVSIQHLVARLFLPSLFLVIGRNAAMALFRHTAIVQGFNSKNLHTLTSQEAQLYITELQAQAKKIESIHFKGGVSLAVLMFIQLVAASKRIKQIIATAGTCAAIGYVPPEYTLECVRKKNYKNLMFEGQKQVEELYSDVCVNIQLIDTGSVDTSFFLITNSIANKDVNHLKIAKKIHKYFDGEVLNSNEQSIHIPIKDISDNNIRKEKKEILKSYLQRTSQLNALMEQLNIFITKMPRTSFCKLREITIKDSDILPKKSFEIGFDCPLRSDHKDQVTRLIKSLNEDDKRNEAKIINDRIYWVINSNQVVKTQIIDNLIKECNLIYPHKFAAEKQQMSANGMSASSHKLFSQSRAGFKNSISNDNNIGVQALPVEEIDAAIMWKVGDEEISSADDTVVKEINGHPEHFVRFNLNPEDFNSQDEHDKFRDLVNKAQISSRNGFIWYNRLLQTDRFSEGIMTSLKIRTVKLGGDTRLFATPILSETGQTLHDVSIIRKNAHQEKQKRQFKKR